MASDLGHHMRLIWVAVALLIVAVVVALGAGGVVIVGTFSSSRSNCEDINELKGAIRKTIAYNDVTYRKTLKKFGIDPDSAQGADLIADAKAAADVYAINFADRNC